MEYKTQDRLLLEDLLAWLSARIRRYGACIFTSLGAGALAYVFAFTNKLINYDDVNCLFSKGSTITWGRWGLDILEAVFPNYSMPWLYGVLTMLLVCAASCIMVSLFSIENRLMQGLLGGCVMVFPSLIGTFGYMFTSSSYALAILLAVLSVWLLCRRQIWCKAGAVACLVFSLSIYQSYVSMASSLLLLVLIQQLLSGADLAAVVRRGFFFLGFLAVSLGLYYIATQVVFLLVDSGFGSYATEILSFSPAFLLEGLKSALYNFVGMLFFGFFGLIPTRASLIAHIVCLACGGALLPYGWLRQGRAGVGRFALLLVLLGLLPLSINCMYLFTADSSIHTLVLYGFVTLYALALLVAHGRFPSVLPALGQKLARNGIVLALAAILTQNIFIANQAYLNLYLRYENTYAFYTALFADIQMMPEFTQGTRLALIGQWQDPPFYRSYFSEALSIAGVDGFKPDDYSKQAFVDYYMGFPITFADQQEVDAIAASEEFAAMAVYPYYGSVAKIGDVLVVKLS